MMDGFILFIAPVVHSYVLYHCPAFGQAMTMDRRAVPITLRTSQAQFADCRTE